MTYKYLAGFDGYAHVDALGGLSAGSFASLAATLAPYLSGSGLISLNGDVNGPVNANHVDSLTPAGATLPLITSGAITRGFWDTTHGALRAGGGGSDFFTQIGQLVTAEISFGAIYMQPAGTTITGATQWIMAGNLAQTFIGFPTAGTFHISQPGVGDWVTLTAAGGMTWYNATSQGIANIEPVHGRAQFGGGGSDYKAILGPLVGFETSDAGIWFLPGATAPTSVNVALWCDASNTFMNNANANAILGFIVSGSTYLGAFNGAQSRFYVGGSTASVPFIFDWATSLQSQILAGSAQTSMLIATTRAGAVIQIAPDNASRLFSFAGGTQNGVALGANLASIGHIRSPSGWTWFSRNATNSGDRSVLFDDGADHMQLGRDYVSVTVGSVASTTEVDILTASIIAFETGGTIYSDATAFMWRDNAHGNCAQVLLASAGACSISFIETVPSWTIGYYSRTSDAATYDFKLQGQYAFATATGTNRTPGNLIFDIGAPTNASTTEAFFKFTRNGSVIGQIGSFNGTTQTMLWLGGATAPTSANYAFDGDASTFVNINAPSAQVMEFTQGGSVFLQYFPGSGDHVYFGGFNTAAPFYIDWSTSTTPVLSSGTSATLFSVGTNKTGAKLLLLGGDGTEIIDVSDTQVDIVNGANMTVDGSIQIGSAPQWGGGTYVLGVVDAPNVPTTNPAGGGILYSEAGAGKWRGSSGTVTTFGPADLAGFKDTPGEGHCPSCGTDFAHEWQNEKYGTLTICMKCLADELGERPWIVRRTSCL